MTVNVDAPRYRLIVTGPARDRLYERFSVLFRGRDDVEVVRDRRCGERRRQRAAVSVDRRSRERRHRTADWIVPPD